MRTKLILFMALIMGLATTVLFYSYMKKYDAETVAVKATEEIVVAAETIKKNQKITDGMLKLAAVPKKSIHKNTVRSIDEIKGKFATSEILKGEPILKHRVQSITKEKQYVSLKVHEGYRAISIDVAFAESVSNLIEPEDRVDIIFTEKIKKNGEPFIKSELLLSNVRVLAVGRRLIESGEGGKYVKYQTTTFELKPLDGVRLVNASQKGEIHLMIHSRVKGAEEEAENNDG